MARRWDDEALVTVRPRDGEKLVTARRRDGAAKVVRVERERSRESGLEESSVKLFLVGLVNEFKLKILNLSENFY